MKQKVACFSMLVFLVTLFLLSVEVGVVGANDPPKMTKSTELEEKLAKVEADLKQMKSEFGQVETGLTEMKEGLEKIQKKMIFNEEAIKKQMLDNKRIPIPFWLILITVVIFALVCMYIILGISAKKKAS